MNLVQEIGNVGMLASFQGSLMEMTVKKSMIAQKIHHSVNMKIQWVDQRHQIGTIRLVNKQNQKGQYPEEEGH